MAKTKHAKQIKRKRRQTLKGGNIKLEKQFIDACANNDLERAIQLLHDNPMLNNSANNSVFEEAFTSACRKNYLEVAKWLYFVKPDIKISGDRETNFKIACEYGHLKMVEWLLFVKPDIKISTDDEAPFRMACAYGHLNVAQLLLIVKPDINISILGDRAFKMACRNRHLHVAQWLQTLKPYAYNAKECRVYTKKEQEMNMLLYSMYTSGNENALTPDVVDGLNKYIE